MSHNASGTDKAAAASGSGQGSAQAQAPKLRSGAHYSQWKADMEVYLERYGAGGVHARVIDPKEWKVLVAKVDEAKKTELDAALQLILGAGSQSAAVASTSLSASTQKGSRGTSPVRSVDPREAALKVVREHVERSIRVYGVLYAALPEELRQQAESVARGNAYGLWKWLEDKFQSTEQDSVGILLEQWISLRQEEGETFDAYRARVDKLFALLKTAKEEPSARMRSLITLDRLLPQYKQGVLALKAGGKLKDATAINWDEIATFVNGIERETQRDGAATSDGTGGAWANSAQMRQKLAAREESDRRPPRDNSKLTCFLCDQQGHIVRDCPEKGKHSGGTSSRGGRGGGRGGRGGRSVNFADTSSEQASSAVKHSSNRFEPLSSDEDEEWDSGEQSEDHRAHCAIANMQRAYAAGASAPKKIITLAAKEKLEADKAKEAARRAPKPAADAKPASDRKPEPPVAKEDKQATKPRTYAQLDAALSGTAWGWDTMASVCISGNRNCFRSLRKCPAVEVKTADGAKVTAVQVGTVVLRLDTDAGRTLRFEVDNVLFHERFASNLLSGERMTKQLKWQYHATEESTWVLTPLGNRITLSTRGRISVLLGGGGERVYSGVTTRVSAPNELVRLHERLGHMPFNRLAKLVHGGKVMGLGSFTSRELAAARTQVLECRACSAGKQARTNFDHRGLQRGTAPGEVLHMDSYVVKCKGSDGEPYVTYGISVMDSFSREAWHAHASSKDVVASAVITLLKQIETHTGKRLKQVFTDGGTEFNNQTLKNWLASKGAMIRASPPHTQQLDGVAERSIRTFKDSGRTLLEHARAPQWLWRHAVNHSVWLWNRSHVSSSSGQTPYQAGTGRLPSLKLSTLGVWGCDCYVHLRKEVRVGAMSAKSEPAIYLGHCEGVSAANVLLLSTGKRVVSRDVRFLSTFKHMAALKAGKEEVEALLDGTNELISSPVDSEPRPERAPALGERKEEAAEDSDAESSDESVLEDAEEGDPDEWQVDHISKRRVIRGKGPEYLVHWTGFGPESDSWEREENVSDCQAYQEFMAAHAAPRRSPRLATGSDSGSLAEASGMPGEADDALEAMPRVEMAMSALRSLQLPKEQLTLEDEQRVMNAISAGVAALEDRTPQTLKEALAGTDAAAWRAARQKEYDSCVAQGVWEEVPRESLPKGTNILPCKDVFKIKVAETGDIAQFKVRFTPKGCRQKRSEYGETYARTAMYKTERVALSLAAHSGNVTEQFDIPVAFLNAPVDELVYMELPSGFGKQGHVGRLLKSMYGLKQAPRNWDRLIHGFITGEMGWKATVSDPSFYFRRSKTGRLMLLYRFVDDMQGQYHPEDKAEFAVSSGMLSERFNIKKIDTATWMLGMRITRDEKAGTITLDQELYITKALERFSMDQCKPVASPEVPGAAKDRTPSLDVPCDRQRYMEIVGTLMYAAISTRLDICHAVHYLAGNMVAPTVRHMKAAEHVLRYLAGTKEVGLVFGKHKGSAALETRGRSINAKVDVCAFADSDYAEDQSDRKSVSGWVAKLNGDPVSWSSKKQPVVALSTCEAELYAEAAAIQEVLWLRGLCSELGLNVECGASTVYGDNQAAIAVSANGIKSQRTKHVDVKYHFITETIEAEKVKLQWVPSAQQQADIFTKALATPIFLGLRKQLMTR
jgi:transposase InsO family protein